MNLKGIIDGIEKLLNLWSRRFGLILVVFIIILVYFTFIYPLFTNYFKSFSLLCFLIIPITIFIILFFIWYLSTNRLCFKGNSIIAVGLFLNIDESDAVITIKKIAKACIEELKNDHSNIKIILYPINYKRSINEIQNYLKSRNFCLDAMVYAKVESGKSKTENGFENKIVIKSLTFSGNLICMRIYNYLNLMLILQKT